MQRPVKLVAISPSFVPDDLLVERVLVEDYRAPQVNVEILERYREQVFLVKPTQRLQAGPERPRIADSLQILTGCLGERLSLQRNLRPNLDRQ